MREMRERLRRRSWRSREANLMGRRRYRARQGPATEPRGLARFRSGAVREGKRRVHRGDEVGLGSGGATTWTRRAAFGGWRAIASTAGQKPSEPGTKLRPAVLVSRQAVVMAHTNLQACGTTRSEARHTFRTIDRARAAQGMGGASRYVKSASRGTRGDAQHERREAERARRAARAPPRPPRASRGERPRVRRDARRLRGAALALDFDAPVAVRADGRASGAPPRVRTDALVVP